MAFVFATSAWFLLYIGNTKDLLSVQKAWLPELYAPLIVLQRSKCVIVMRDCKGVWQLAEVGVIMCQLTHWMKILGNI